jgi:hypothetical protein
MLIINTYLHIIRIVACSAMIAFLNVGILPAQYNADVMKAVYIEKITRFIDWPAAGSEKDSTVFVIGVYEDSKFYSALDDVFKGKKIKDKKVFVNKITTPNQLNSCDICYFSGKDISELKKFVKEANNNGVLTISEYNGFGEAGIHINFYLEDDKLKFEINKESTDQGKFRISSLLLKSAKIIQ